MVKYLIKEGNRGMFKVGTDDIDVIDYISTGINWTYQADDDGTVTFKDGKMSYTTDVKKGDIVVQFYVKDGRKHPILVISDEKWKENIEGVRQADLKRAEEMKAKCCDCKCLDYPCEDTCCEAA